MTGMKAYARRIPAEGENKKIRKTPARRPPMAPPPGVWFQALTIVLMVDVWVPAMGRILRIEKMAKAASLPGCGKCQRRKNMMNNHGWRGLPRLLCRRDFWSDGRKRGGGEWKRKQQPESPTTATS